LKTVETQHLSLVTSGPSLPCGEFPSGTAWPALRCQMRPPQRGTCDKFGVSRARRAEKQFTCSTKPRTNPSPISRPPDPNYPSSTSIHSHSHPPNLATSSSLQCFPVALQPENAPSKAAGIWSVQSTPMACRENSLELSSSSPTGSTASDRGYLL
jgi:hypothetical protein